MSPDISPAPNLRDQVLELLGHGGSVPLRYFRQHLPVRVSDHVIRSTLQKLMDEGTVGKKGKKAGTRYQLTRTLNEPPPDEAA